MDYLGGFLQYEINFEESYNDIMYYILSYQIRSGEFEGNEYIIKKIDLDNFYIFPEYNSCNGISIKKDDLIKAINNYALLKGIKVML